jgi:cytochrome c2
LINTFLPSKSRRKLNAMSSKFLTIPIAAFSLLCSNCGSKEEAGPTAEAASNSEQTHKSPHGSNGSVINNVDITSPLNRDWVTKGKAVYEMKCSACHRLDDTRLVGPGWSGVTKRRDPVWIMNMITNVDVMLEKDAEAQKLLKEWVVRMPNQNITKTEARELLEFMRSNDGEK